MWSNRKLLALAHFIVLTTHGSFEWMHHTFWSCAGVLFACLSVNKMIVISSSLLPNIYVELRILFLNSGSYFALFCMCYYVRLTYCLIFSYSRNKFMQRLTINIFLQISLF